MRYEHEVLRTPRRGRSRVDKIRTCYVPLVPSWAASTGRQALDHNTRRSLHSRLIVLVNANQVSANSADRPGGRILG